MRLVFHMCSHTTVYGFINACDPNCRKICVLAAYTCSECLDSPPFVVSINVVNILRHTLTKILKCVKIVKFNAEIDILDCITNNILLS